LEALGFFIQELNGSLQRDERIVVVGGEERLELIMLILSTIEI